MGIFSFLTGNKSDDGMTSQDVVVGKRYRYLADVPNTNTLTTMKR